MSALLCLSLLHATLLLAPPSEAAVQPESPASPEPTTEPAGSEQPTQVEVPPPSLITPEPGLDDGLDDDDEPQPEQPHNPRGLAPVSPNPAPPEPEEDPYELRSAADMPFAPTAARKSAVRRNNQILVRAFRQPLYSISANARFGTLLSGGRDVIQPFGYGFAAALRLYFVPVGKARFGVEAHAGHTRWPEREKFPTIDGEATITRASLLSDTDFSAGPSLSIPIGPLFVEFGGSAGVALSTLLRPTSADATEDQLVSTSNFMLRGGGGIGLPLLNQHGLSLHVAAQHIFSPREVMIEPLEPESETTRPFGTWLEVSLGYQIWF